MNKTIAFALLLLASTAMASVRADEAPVGTPSGPDVGFTAAGQPTRKGAGTPFFCEIQAGTAGGRPARKVTMLQPNGAPSSIIFVSHAGRARTFAEARRRCTEMSPARTWDLPDMMLTIGLGIIDVLPETRYESERMDLFWALDDNDAANAAMAGTATLLTIADGSPAPEFLRQRANRTYAVHCVAR